MELIDSRVSLKQCKLAIEALHTHESKKEQKHQESELLPRKEQNVWLNVTVKKIPPGHKFKPLKIPIAHPLIDPRTTSVCLITKDPQREYKDLLEAHNIKFISRVIGIEKLKGKFKPFEARRMLLKENGLFLADERVIPLLPKLLGVKWFEAKKQPIPVCLQRKDLKGELERAISSTYMNQNRGTCTSVKVGTLSQKPTQILANIKLALPVIAKNIYGGWDNIQTFHIKTNSSVSLPVWSCSLDESEGGRWNGLTADGDGGSSDEGSDEEEMEVEVPVKMTAQGKKRAQGGEEEEKSKKRKKGAEEIVAEPVTKKNKVSVKTPTEASKPPSKATKLESETPLKTKKQKSLGSEPLPTLPKQPAMKPLVKATDTPGPTPSKKKTGKPAPTIVDGKLAAVEKNKDKSKRRDVVDPVALPLIAAADDSNIKKKLRPSISNESAVQPPQTAAPEPANESPPKKKGKKEATASEPAAAAIDTPENNKDGKNKRKKMAKAIVEAEAIPSATLTKDEMKQKRSTGTGEKKKTKVRSMGGKSAKDGILGKKIAGG